MSLSDVWNGPSLNRIFCYNLWNRGFSAFWENLAGGLRKGLSYIIYFQNIFSDISHCASRALSENSERYDIILYAAKF